MPSAGAPITAGRGRAGGGVERFDYTKGIADRFRAVQSLLESHPEWIGTFTLLQVAAPTRGRLAAYQITQEEAESLAAEINDRFGRDGWRPIELVARHHEPEAVLTLFRAADLCLVSSLHDGRIWWPRNSSPPATTMTACWCCRPSPALRANCARR